MKLAVIYTKDGDDDRDLAATELAIFDSHPDALVARCDALNRARIQRELGPSIDWALADSPDYRDFDVFEVQRGLR